MRTLTSNVKLGDTWYGPAYGNAEIDDDLAGQIENPAAFAPVAVKVGRNIVETIGQVAAPYPTAGDDGDAPVDDELPDAAAAADAGADDGDVEADPYEGLNKDDLVALAISREDVDGITKSSSGKAALAALHEADAAAAADAGA